MPTIAELTQTLLETLTSRWSTYPQEYAQDLHTLLEKALTEAASASPEVLTVAGTTTRPQVLKLANLAKASSDDWYAQDWTEFACSHDGQAFIVYRRKDGEHYAAPWSEGSALPEDLMKSLPPALVMALYGDGGA